MTCSVIAQVRAARRVVGAEPTGTGGDRLGVRRAPGGLRLRVGDGAPDERPGGQAADTRADGRTLTRPPAVAVMAAYIGVTDAN